MTVFTGLTSYWNLNGTSTDYIGTNNGTDSSIAYSTGNGKILQGAGFNGSSSQILIGTGLPYFAKTSPISFSFWVKTSVTTFQAIAFNENSSFSAQFQVYMGADAGGVMEYAYSPANSGANQLVARSTSSFAGGAFHHCVITYDGTGTPGGVLFYKDGVLDTTVSVTNTLSTSATNDSRTSAIGVRNQTSSGFFNGALDELGIWTRALSSSEVTTLYNSGSGLSLTTQNNITVANGSFTLTGEATTFTGPATHLGPQFDVSKIVTSSPDTIIIGAHPRRIVFVQSNTGVGPGPSPIFPTATFNGQSIVFPTTPQYLGILNTYSPCLGYYVIPDNLGAGTYTVTTNNTSGAGTVFSVFYDCKSTLPIDVVTGSGIQNTTSPFTQNITGNNKFSLYLKGSISSSSLSYSSGAGETNLETSGSGYVATYKNSSQEATSVSTLWSGGGSNSIVLQVSEVPWGGLFQMTASGGSVSLTGFSATLQLIGIIYPLSAGNGSFTLTGFASTLIYKANPWHPTNKSSASFNVQSKSSTTMTPTNKSSASFSVQSKS